MIPSQRIHSYDVYHHIDWVVEGWADDEWTVTRRLNRLEDTLRTFFTRYDPTRLEAALELYRGLCFARLSETTPWREHATRLRAMVATVDSLNRLGG